MSYLGRYVPQPDVEDVMQRVFYELWRVHDRYDPNLPGFSQPSVDMIGKFHSFGRHGHDRGAETRERVDEGMNRS